MQGGLREREKQRLDTLDGTHKMRDTAPPPPNPVEARSGAAPSRRFRGVRVALLSAALLLGVGGFVFFALWESLAPPGRTVRAGGLQIHLATAPNPVRVGENQVELVLEQGGRSVDDANVELRYALDPLAGSTPLALADARPVGEGRYRGAVAFGRPGPWQLTVLVKRPGVPDVEAQYTFNLAADASAAIAGQVRLAAGRDERLPAGAVLFVIARRGPGPPVAVKRIEDPRFPLAFRLSQADAMAGATFEGELELVARLKMDGRAGSPAPGDLEGKAPGLLRVGSRDVVIVIDRAP